MTDVAPPSNPTLPEVLRGGRQCDEDGTEIIMSRQACCEAADEIERLQAQLLQHAETCKDSVWPDGPTGDYRDVLYSLLVRQGRAQHEAHTIAYGTAETEPCIQCGGSGSVYGPKGEQYECENCGATGQVAKRAHETTAASVASEPGTLRVDEGELWSFLRSTLSQGGDIWLDHREKSHELYMIRLDGAARERADKLIGLLGATPTNRERRNAVTPRTTAKSDAS